MSSVLFLSNQGLSQHWCAVRGRCQPGGATHHGSGIDRRDSSSETKTLQSSRHLSDHCTPFEFANDWNGDVALVSAASVAGVGKGFSQVVLQGCHDTRGIGHNG